jgi:hypothetical protein
MGGITVCPLAGSDNPMAILNAIAMIARIDRAFSRRRPANWEPPGLIGLKLTVDCMLEERADIGKPPCKAVDSYKIAVLKDVLDGKLDKPCIRSILSQRNGAIDEAGVTVDSGTRLTVGR